jgi:ABC-2 type transport system permease protein
MSALLNLFLRNGLKSRRTWWMALLGLFPVGAAMLLWLLNPLIEKDGTTLWGLFPPLGLMFFLNLLLPLMTIFVGTAVITDEVEERTLAYLLTRPVQRGRIVLAKLVAGFLTLGTVLALSLLATYTVLVVSEGVPAWGRNLGLLLKAEGVLLLGLAAYLALFALLGGLFKRAVWVGLLFAFGWERLVAMLPGNVKLATVIHYLHRLYPITEQGRGGDIRSLIFGAPAPPSEVSELTALLVLLALTALFALLAARLLSWKEYRLEQGE